MKRPKVIARARVRNADLVAMVVKACVDASHNVRPPVVPEGSELPMQLYLYLVTEIQYLAETGTQIIRRPNALVLEGVGDCKSTAVFIGSICKAAGMDVRLAFIKTAERPWYSHVYAIVDGVVVDPLLDYGEECDYIYRKLVRI